MACQDRIHYADTVSVRSSLRGADAVVIMSGTLGHQIEWFFKDAMKRGEPITHIAVEGQSIYAGRTKNPMDILRLGQVAGACVCACMSVADKYRVPVVFLELPEPKDWKGQVPKAIHQDRVLRFYGAESLGWEWTPYKDRKQGVKVTESPILTMSPTRWKHALDGIGLARWAAYEGKIPKKRKQ